MDSVSEENLHGAWAPSVKETMLLFHTIKGNMKKQRPIVLSFVYIFTLA